jgi:hypothetical protein
MSAVKKLTGLRRAAAIQAAAAKISQVDSEGAGQVAMVIDQVFSDPRPNTTWAGLVML